MTDDPLNTRAAELSVQSSVKRGDRKNLANMLNGVLASSYVLYAKTHAFHWNVTGPLFYSVHKLTDEQYNELAEAVDDIAERIRAIGFPAMSGLKAYLNDSVVDDPDSVPRTREMVETLARDHQAVAEQARKAALEAEEVNDLYSHDLLVSRIGVHEEAAWMLNALLVDDA